VFPYSEVVFINTAMDKHVRPVGWLLNNAECSKAQTINFAEYQSTDLDGTPIDVTQRLACSTQLTPEKATQYSDPAFVLGGWVPNTVNAIPEAVAPGDEITANWSAPHGHSTADWVGLYRSGAADTDYIALQAVGTDATTGVLSFTASVGGGGALELRYFLADGVESVAKSGRIQVRGSE
jgi:hypothetical protein